MTIPVGDMSGGERRRADMAAVMLRKPACLVLDEPFQSLDPKDADSIGKFISKLAAGGCAVVVSGHEVGTIMGIANTVTWCTGGTTHELGTPTIAYREYPFRKEFLGLT
jgi:ABC-type multidrug transport system ATPase subunit